MATSPTQSPYPLTDRGASYFLLGFPPQTVHRSSRTFPGKPPRARAMSTPHLKRGRSRHGLGHHLGPRLTTSANPKVPTRATGRRGPTQLSYLHSRSFILKPHWEVVPAAIVGSTPTAHAHATHFHSLSLSFTIFLCVFTPRVASLLCFFLRGWPGR